MVPRWSYRALMMVALTPFALAATVPVNAAEPTPTNSPTTTANVYVYWSYWDQPTVGSWAVAATGAGSQVPPDGSVVGWRYGVGTTGDINQPPRSADSFAQLCSSTPPVANKKRVGVVIDYGTAAVAPSGQQPPATTANCAVVDPTSNALQATGAVTAERTSAQGMVCGLSGYPATGCGTQVSTTVATSDVGAATQTTTSPQTSSGAWPTLLGIGIIIVLGVGGILLARKRRA